MKILKLLSIGVLFAAFLINPTKSFALETQSLLPIADGFYKQWDPKSGSTHYTMVDEAICNGTTDFNATTTVSERDSYKIDISSVPNGSTISDVTITPCASQKGNGNGSSVMNLFYRLDGQNSSDLGNYNLDGTTPVMLAPASFGLSVVKTQSSALEIGTVLSAGTKGVRLGQIEAKLTYTPLFSPSNLTATPSSSSALLNWTDNSVNELGFKVERSTDSANFVNIATVSANVTSFLNSGLISGQYYYRVRSYNIGAESSPSGVASVFIP